MNTTPAPAERAPSLSLAQGRLFVVLAAVLWSSSGAFTKLLREPTGLGFDQPALPALQIAFFRVLFGGLVLLPLVRPSEISFRPLMLLMALSFAVMNGLYIWAQAMGSAANAVLLQYTAPMWMYLFCVGVLREPAERRGALALLIGLAGIGVIVAGSWAGGELPVVLIALGSGVTFAGVLIGLRLLRGLSPAWLTVWNFLFGALALVPFIWTFPLPGPKQLLVLVVFGGLQLGLPYWLVARGLRRVSPQEAGTLTLLEPLLNPVWAYLVSPETEKPTWATALGGACILGALAYRYWPSRREAIPERVPDPEGATLP